MKILVIHNSYVNKGGEDVSVASEIQLLRSNGHDVTEYIRSNDELICMPKFKAALTAVWSFSAYKDIFNILSNGKFDIVHIHNTFPLISPSVFWAVKKLSVPLVMSIRNFRLICPEAMFLRNGKICEDCIGHVPWRAVYHKCYRNSFPISFIAALVLSLHRFIGTFDKVDLYIALSEFTKSKLLQAGFDSKNVVVKPNSIQPSELKQNLTRSGALFVGRLSYEKGISILAEAFSKINGINLIIAGDGPLRSLLMSNSSIELIGSVPKNKLDELMSGSSFLVMPTITYETFGRVVVEAFSNGLPVIASRIGSLSELIEDQVDGLFFEPGDPVDLQSKIEWAINHPSEMKVMGDNALRKFNTFFSEQSCYQKTIDIYRSAIDKFWR